MSKVNDQADGIDDWIDLEVCCCTEQSGTSRPFLLQSCIEAGQYEEAEERLGRAPSGDVDGHGIEEPCDADDELGVVLLPLKEEHSIQENADANVCDGEEKLAPERMKGVGCK